MISILCWQLVRPWKPLRVVEQDFESAGIIPAILLGVLLAVGIGPLLEGALFDSDLQGWLYTYLQVQYDPRNCVVIAFCPGLCGHPDYFSNVPRSLTAASLALGAGRWKTVWRVVLPSASPSLFAGVMIGFGRAVGETMIVLMATGNTPIMNWSPFNGMRTLFANIAVEIPEAPLGGTLYRTLFLSAVVLFLMTSVLNTGAELIRQHLRKKYGQFQ